MTALKAGGLDVRPQAEKAKAPQGVEHGPCHRVHRTRCERQVNDIAFPAAAAGRVSVRPPVAVSRKHAVVGASREVAAWESRCVFY
jgi:hypothetical protein